MRWVAYSTNVYHAAYDDLEPLCGMHRGDARWMSVCLKEVAGQQERAMARVDSYMCRRCQRVTDERPSWPWHKEAPNGNP